MYKPLASICTDDFGLAPGIDQGILNLVEAKKIHLVSVMVIENSQTDQLMKLAHLKTQGFTDVSLHFCITGRQNIPLVETDSSSGYTDNRGHFLSPTQLFLNCILGRVNYKKLDDELSAQIRKYEEYFGIIEFLDSHHHIHQWPGINQFLVEFIKRRKLQTLVRQTQIPVKLLLNSMSWRNMGLTILGTLFKRQLIQAHIPHNKHFGIFSNYDNMADHRWLKEFETASSYGKELYWCTHPASHVDGIAEKDHLIDQRLCEYRLIRSL